jgi:hypothetical protein
MRRAHNIGPDEMELLSSVASTGQVPSARAFVYIQNAVRQALRVFAAAGGSRANPLRS